MNLNKIWQTTLGTLQLQTSRQEFDTWFSNTTLLGLENGTATIGTASTYHKEQIENRYMSPVRRSLGDVVGFPVQVQIVIAPPPAHPYEALPLRPLALSQPAYQHDSDADEQHNAPPSAANGAGVAMPYVKRSDTHRNSSGNGVGAGEPLQHDLMSMLRTSMFNPKYTFSSFIVGASNRMANAACQAVADHPAHAYNPLFLYGGVGLGKTHLLHAIGNHVLERDPEINVLYVSSERFTNELINAIRGQKNEEFRIRYRNIDVLLIDDIQFIAGKDATQEEFFHTFNTLHSATKQIVISSDRPPKAIVTLEERLRSRFEWGLIVDIQPPDLETRTAILRAKGDQLQIPIPPNVVDFLAHKIQSNIRELEGSLNRVTAYARLNNLPITVDVAAAALSELLNDNHRKRITPEAVIQAVCEYYGIDQRTMLGRGRSRNIVVPRHVAMYLLREETGSSLVEIGTLLGGRDHTTVIHGCEKIADEITTDHRLRNEVLAIREKLYK